MTKTSTYFKDIPLTGQLREYLLQFGGMDTPEQKSLRELAERSPQVAMQTTPEQGQFIYFLVRLIGAHKALELGVFMGYGTLSIALALPADGKVIACELNPEPLRLAQPYWQQAGVMDKIDLKIGPAWETLDQLQQEGMSDFDFVFIDADKNNYMNYYEQTLPLMRSGGLLALDNTLWSGKIADKSVEDAQTESFRKLNAHIHQDKRVDMCLLPIADGMTLVHKK